MVVAFQVGTPVQSTVCAASRATTMAAKTSERHPNTNGPRQKRIAGLSFGGVVDVTTGHDVITSCVHDTRARGHPDRPLRAVFVFSRLPAEAGAEADLALAPVLRAGDHGVAIQIGDAAVRVQPQVRDVAARVAES